MAKQEIQRVEPPESPIIQIGKLVQQSDGKIDTAGMEKLLEMHFRHEADEARKVFASDFAVVQSEIASVVKSKFNPQTKSWYAGLDGVIEMVKPVYTEQGFSIIYYEGETGVAENIRVCADVLHKAGHKETYHLDVPLDGKELKGNANMTKIHGKMSSASYGRRNLLCMIWNIPTRDDDGNGPGKTAPQVSPPTEKEWGFINEVCKAMTQKPGKRVDPKKVAAICYENTQEYPHDKRAVNPVAKWLSDMNRPELYIDEPKDEFDEFAEKYNAEHNDVGGLPDLPEPDEPTEPRYYCRTCDKDFEKFKLKGVCPEPECLSRDIVDRRPPVEPGEVPFGDS